MTVFIIAKFFFNKLFMSADKGCLILVSRSDLFQPHDFNRFDRFEISHFPCPFLVRMLVDCVNFSILSPVKMGHFFLSSLFFRFSKYTYVHV